MRILKNANVSSTTCETGWPMMRGKASYWLSSLKMIFESILWWPNHHYRLFKYYKSVATNAKVKILQLSDGSVLQSSEPGTPFQLFSEIWHHKVYNPPGFEIQSNYNVVDIGAHIGGFTLWAARQTHGIVLAVEPLRSAFESLKETIAINGLTNVRAINAAVSKSSGSCEIRRIPGTNMGSTLAASKMQHTSESHIIDCISIEELISGLNSVDFLKIDVEGAEFEIIESLRPDLTRRIARIAMEYHNRIGDKDHRWITDQLEELGYETRIIRQKGDVGYIYAWRSPSTVSAG